MSLSLLARKVVVGWFLAVAVPAVGFAQTNFVPQGGEYGISGALPGDQVFPKLSVNSGGGYTVWQDNNTDGDGLGISGRPLDSNFAPVFAPFRVNGRGSGDQEKPQVALLKDGGAVFVWQGGKQSFQHVYARFLSSSNTWLTGDVMVNADTNHFQIDPAVTVLGNGNVVIVYSSFDQQGTGSMQDVFGQILSPAGQKIGGEFPINQFTLYNQRTPTVAALNNGGFATVWVSEQERAIANLDTNKLYAPQQLPLPSVDIYGRLYDASGSPTVNEFLVNISSNVCANPMLAVGADNTFAVAWSGRDTLVRNNSWDIYTRTFSLLSGIVVGGTEQRVNTQLYGDQFAPQIGASGTNYLVVWTSLGQDGSREGVYGQFLNADGSRSGGEFRVNTTTVRQQMHPAVASDNLERFLVVWTGFTGWPNVLDLFGQRYNSIDATVPPYSSAYLSPTFVADNSSDGGGDSSGGSGGNTGPGPITSGRPRLNFPGSLVPSGTVLPDGPALAAGSYSGLFYDTNGVDALSSGYFNGTVTVRRTFSFKIITAGASCSVSGQFDSNGRFNGVASAKSGGSLTVSLQLDLSGGNRITGTITDGHWTAALLAYKSVPQGLGKYTLIIPGKQNDPNSPAGSGFGTLTVNSKGSVKWSGTLADGTRVTQQGSICAGGIWPLYINSPAGTVVSWIQFASQANSDLGGPLVWIKSQGSPGPYTGGFTNEVTATGSSYSPPAKGAKVLGGGTGTMNLTLRGGSLASAITSALRFETGNKITDLSGNKLTLNVTASSGLFTGSVQDPGTGKTMVFQGALLKKANTGAGFFLDSGKSGEASLNPAP